MRAIALILALLAMTAGVAEAQGAWRRGGVEAGAFAGGGPSIAGGVGDRAFLLAGGRWGWQLTGPRGGGASRGHLQYAVEAIPLYFQLQRRASYGLALTPILLRYHFTGGRAVVPFVEGGAGMLLTRDRVPENTSRFNFTPQAGVGVQYAPGRGPGFVFGVRYHHTSNAGISNPNPGINALLLHAGVSWWR
jgi:lipid A 3-O-deacylase